MIPLLRPRRWCPAKGWGSFNSQFPRRIDLTRPGTAETAIPTDWIFGANPGIVTVSWGYIGENNPEPIFVQKVPKLTPRNSWRFITKKLCGLIQCFLVREMKRQTPLQGRFGRDVFPSHLREQLNFYWPTSPESAFLLILSGSEGPGGSPSQEETATRQS